MLRLVALPLAATSFVLLSTGSIPLQYEVTTPAADTWASVLEPSRGVLSPGEQVAVSVRASSANLPPTLYSTTISIRSNIAATSSSYPPTQVVSLSTGGVLSVPWSFSVILALLFPDNTTVGVNPALTAGVPVEYNIVNFAGVPMLISSTITAVDARTSGTWAAVVNPVQSVKIGDIAKIEVVTWFPTLRSIAAAAVSVSYWTVPRTRLLVTWKGVPRPVGLRRQACIATISTSRAGCS